MDGPGLIASVTTPEPVVTPKPIRSRPTDAVAATAAPATPPVTHSLTHTLFPMPLESTGRLHALLDLRVALERPRRSRSP